MKSLLVRIQILITTYLTLARQFWWHRRKSGVTIVGWIIGIFEYTLAILGSIVFVSIYPLRSTIVFGIFNWMRSIDDLIDGDNPHAHLANIEIFINSKGQILDRILNAKTYEYIEGADLFDKGLAYAIIQAEKIGIGHIVRTHISTIWNLMIIEKNKFSHPAPRIELDTFAERQDKAIGELMCILMGGDIATLDTWWNNRGVFTKIDWMKDLDKDLEQGLIHIAQETLDALQISIQDLLLENDASKTHRFRCIQFELKEIDRQWEKVIAERKVFAKSFPSFFVQICFNHLAIGGFDHRFARLKTQYEIIE